MVAQRHVFLAPTAYIGSVGATNKGNSPSNEQMAEWRSEAFLHTSSRSSPEIRPEDIARVRTNECQGPDGKIYEHTTSVEQRYDAANKRQRRNTSGEQSDSNDSVVSDVNSSCNYDNASSPDATSMENYSSITVWTVW